MTFEKQKTREIIDDFASEIRKKRIEASPVERVSIDFRNGILENREEVVYKVPLDILRFRKENGRISSSVKSYERTTGLLHGADIDAQRILHKFLRDKDPEKTDELKNLLLSDGQREPGIITVDGFLINGNRRKVALEELKLQFPQNDAFQTMKVVILPGRDDEGGPPTLKEIEQIENRYQLQAEGKADYYGFDAALSIRDKENSGYTLDQQMRDDPQYKLLDGPTFQRAVRKRRRDLLDPLEFVDEYLEAIGRPGEYAAISRGVNDPKGRWQAFIDLSQSFWNQASTPAGREKMGVDETEVGQIMQAAYSVIRLQDVPDFGKLHGIIRDFSKFSTHGKSHLLELARNVKHELPGHDLFTDDGRAISRDAVEEKWRNKYRKEITMRLAKAREDRDSGSEKNAPVTLLRDAVKKLTHENMVVNNIPIDDLSEALTICNDLCSEANKIKKEIYDYGKIAKRAGMLKSTNAQ